VGPYAEGEPTGSFLTLNNLYLTNALLYLTNAHERSVDDPWEDHDPILRGQPVSHPISLELITHLTGRLPWRSRWRLLSGRGASPLTTRRKLGRAQRLGAGAWPTLLLSHV
jgi:hypothetical protein